MAATPPKPPKKKDNLDALKKVIDAIGEYDDSEKCQILETAIGWFNLGEEINILS